MSTEDTHWFVCELSCPLCTGRVDYVSKSAPDKYHAAFVVECAKCRREMVISVDLVVVAIPDPDECGSEPGYFRHLRAGEEACAECRKAHNAAEVKRRDRQRRKRALVNV